VKLYSNVNSPFVQRVKMGIALRKVTPTQISVVEVDLSNPPASHLAINPTGSVPTFETQEGEGFAESLVILQFLDSLEAAGPKLFGTTSAEVAKNQLLIEKLDTLVMPTLLKSVYGAAQELGLREALAKLPGALKVLEKLLLEGGGDYLGGHRPNAADCFLAPFLMALLAAAELQPRLTPVRDNQTVLKYMQRLEKSEAIQQAGITPAQLKPALHKWVTPTEGIQKVKKASRTLLPHPETALQQFNAEISHKGSGAIELVGSPGWQLKRAEKGPQLEAQFQFSHYDHALWAIRKLCDIQETSDHHTAFQLHDFRTLFVQICTHEPQWGVSEKDLELARCLTQTFSERRDKK
jgi:glutathione S-transferase/pterin-4a-carbinolamine dehydratase